MSADERVVLDVGQIMKAHGLKGQVSVALFTDRHERVAPGMVLETDRGLLHVTASLAHQNRFLVSFAEISDREGADRWRGVILRAEAIEDDDVIWIHDLFGASVETTDGVLRGVVTSVEGNPASDILVLDTGFLVPLTFVVSVEANERIVVEVPEGLFE